VRVSKDTRNAGRSANTKIVSDGFDQQQNDASDPDRYRPWIYP